MVIENSYGLWVMGYGYNFPANQLGKSKKVCLTREYGLYLVSVRRESTVLVGGLLYELLEWSYSMDCTPLPAITTTA
jgi:hypothetical protein